MEQSLASYKAKSFLQERDSSSITYEVKRTRAIWDASLRIPGTNRSGGWRCPTGTRYGGQITDRFGRNCGWGVARRLANEISDLGERLENVSDRRRERRAQRAVGRAQGATRQIRERRGLVERAAGRVANVLEGDGETPKAPRRALPEQVPNVRRMRQGEGRRRGNLRNSEAARMQAEIDRPGGGASDVARRPDAPAVRRRRAATAVAQEKPARRVPPDKAPAKKAVAKKQPAKKAAVKKSVRKATAPAATPERPRTATPAMRPATPARPETPPQQEWVEDFKNLDLGRTIEWRDLNAALGDMYAGEDWADVGAREFDEELDVQSAERSAQAMNREGLAEVARQIESSRNENTQRRRRLRELRLEIAAEQDDNRRKKLAKEFYDTNSTIRKSEKRIAIFQARIDEINAQPEERRNAFELVDELVQQRNFGDWNFQAMFEAQGEEDVAARVNRANAAMVGGQADARQKFADLFGDDPLNDLRAEPDEAVRRFESAEREFGAATLRQRNEARQAEQRMRTALEAANGDKNNRAYIAARDTYRVMQRDYIRAAAAERRFINERTTLDAAIRNAQARPRPEIPDALPEEVAAKAEKRVKDAILDRQAVLADYLDERYGAGNAPWLEMTPDRRKELVRLANGGDAQAKRELTSWAREMYKHDNLESRDGRKYRTVVEGVTYRNGELGVTVSIQHQGANGGWSEIGTSYRTVKVGNNPPTIYNNNMFIRVEGHKNAGIQTIYNQHAFMYAKAAGFKNVSVTAVDDGRYVWGRIGYRQRLSAGQINNMRQELQNFERGQNSVVVKNVEDAQIIKYLLGRYDRDNNSVRHIDFVYAITPRTKADEARVKSWFTDNMTFTGGVFDLDENMIAADPRQNADVASRRRAR